MAFTHYRKQLPRSIRLYAMITVGFTLMVVGLGGCGRSSAAPSVIRLVDVYKAEALHGTPAAAHAALKNEWHFDGAAPVPEPKQFATTRGVEGYSVTGLTIRDGKLVGKTSTDFPILRLERTKDVDNIDQFHSVEIRMKVSAGGTVAMATRGPGPVDFADVERGGRRTAWPITATLVPGDEVQTYVLTSPSPLNASRIRQILIRPSDASGATFEIESVRMILRKDYLNTVTSGVSWQGLNEIYRESLVSRAPEVMTFNLTLPEQPWLDLGLGTIDDQPATFKISIKPESSGAETVLREQTITSPYRWNRSPVDLAKFAGQKVAISLSMIGDAGTVGLWGSPAIRSRQADSGGKASKPQGVILIHADTLRPDHLSLYGAKRETTPFLRKLATEGVLFNNAMSQATWTKVSSSSFLTGLYPTSHGVKTQIDRLPSSVTTMADVFRNAGYATLSLSSVAFTGQYTNLHKGFEELHESTSQADSTGPFTSKSAREYVDRASEWLDLHRDSPFFLYLHVFDPHPPYEPRRPYDTQWADPTKRDEHIRERDSLRKVVADPGMGARGMATREEMAKANVDPATYLAYDEDWYDGSIRGLDAELARLFERLRNAGLDERTLVFFISDHGEEFQDHGRMWHGQSAYGELAHVPMLVRWPGGVPAGHTVDNIVELIDVMPTMIELSGLTGPKTMQGQSLVPLLGMASGSSKSWNARPAITEKQPMRAPNDEPDPQNERDQSWQSFAINDGEWKLIHHTIRPSGRPEFELFDARKDPLDQHDVAAEHADIVQRLTKALDTWHEKALAARLKPDSESTQNLTPEQLKKLRSLGYVK